MAAEAIKQLVEEFGKDPILQKLPLPGSVREAIGLPAEPEPQLGGLKEVAAKALFLCDADTVEIRECPVVPMPDFEKMAKEYHDKYLLPPAPPKIEVIPEESESKQDE